MGKLQVRNVYLEVWYMFLNILKNVKVEACMKIFGAPFSYVIRNGNVINERPISGRP